MPDYPDLDDFFDPCLRLPIGGTVYVIEPPSAVDLIRLRRMFVDANTRATHLDRIDWQAKVLGAAWDAESEQYVGADGSVWAQMLADGVGGEQILRAGETALLHFGVNAGTAAVFWGPDDPFTPLNTAVDKALDVITKLGEPEAKGSNRKQRRAKPKKRTTSPKPTEATHG